METKKDGGRLWAVGPRISLPSLNDYRACILEKGKTKDNRIRRCFAWRKSVPSHPFSLKWGLAHPSISQTGNLRWEKTQEQGKQWLNQISHLFSNIISILKMNEDNECPAFNVKIALRLSTFLSCPTFPPKLSIRLGRSCQMMPERAWRLVIPASGLWQPSHLFPAASRK